MAKITKRQAQLLKDLKAGGTVELTPSVDKMLGKLWELKLIPRPKVSVEVLGDFVIRYVSI